MLEEYYKVRGWNKDGIPTEEKLDELSMIKGYGLKLLNINIEHPLF